MDFIEGETIDPMQDQNILILAAQTQATLHKLDGKKISDEIQDLGHSKESHSMKSRINWLLDRALKYHELSEVFQWLVYNQPELPEKLSVVHGDFHPGNLLVKDGKVQAIIDWSGFIVGDPMAGLGWTLALFIATAKHNVRLDVFEGLKQCYMNEYEKICPVNWDSIEYFTTFRLIMGLLEGLDGQEFWTQPKIVEGLIKEVEKRTGIIIKLSHTHDNYTLNLG
jgi:aminoglycoside phosphotransferase (APT) family kinase protein